MSGLEKYDELVRLARIYMKHASATSFQELAEKLKSGAYDYRRMAANLNGGKPPDIGEEAEIATLQEP